MPPSRLYPAPAALGYREEEPKRATIFHTVGMDATRSHYPIPYADDNPVTVCSPQRHPMVRYCLCAWARGDLRVLPRQPKSLDTSFTCRHYHLAPPVASGHGPPPIAVHPQPAQRRSHSCTLAISHEERKYHRGVRVQWRYINHAFDDLKVHSLPAYP